MAHDSGGCESARQDKGLRGVQEQARDRGQAFEVVPEEFPASETSQTRYGRTKLHDDNEAAHVTQTMTTRPESRLTLSVYYVSQRGGMFILGVCRGWPRVTSE